MKRSLIHKECALKNPMKSYDGEWCKRIYGYANHQYYCDTCGKTIRKDDPCCAESSGLNSNLYFDWEDEFVRKDKNQ
jgi:hypothetical protein